MVLLQRELYFSRDPEGGQTFSRGVQLFPGWGGGVQMLISIETHITCHFPGRGAGVRTPYPPPSGSALALTIFALYKSKHQHIVNFCFQKHVAKYFLCADS